MNIFSPIFAEQTSFDATPCVERHFQGFSLNSIHDLLPSLQNILNTHQNVQFFSFFLLDLILIRLLNLMAKIT